MKTPVFIRKWFNKVTRARFWYVTVDVCPDFTTGQSEMCSYTIRSKDKDEAIRRTIKKATLEWGVTCDEIYVVECVETVSPELIYDVDR